MKYFQQNKFKAVFEELDQFLSTYDLAMLLNTKREQVHKILEQLFPSRIPSKRIIEYVDNQKKKHIHIEYYINAQEAEAILKRAKEINILSYEELEIGMKKLTKKAYNELVKTKILCTGLYNGRSVDEAEIDDELFEHLSDIKNDYKKGVLTAFNADAEMAYNFLKYEESYDDDLDLDYNSDDLYGSYQDNMNDINTHFGGY